MQVRKICLLGDFGVGKTSLVRRFIRQQFSEEYHSTIGVKVDTKEVLLEDVGPVKLVVWDIAGSETLDNLYQRYLKGSAGYVLVADGTRAHTLDGALRLHNQVIANLGTLPWVGLLNKSDLEKEWDLSSDRVAGLEHADLWRPSSAKTGEAVEQAFLELTQRIIS